MVMPKISLAPAGQSLLDRLTPSLKPPAADLAAPAANGGSFADMVKGLVTQAVDAGQQAESLSTAAASGQDVPLHEIVQAVSKAELTLQTLITVRDKAVEAYQQIQQLPI
jgi:flagellar hook-basal body complex protein FliE